MCPRRKCCRFLASSSRSSLAASAAFTVLPLHEFPAGEVSDGRAIGAAVAAHARDAGDIEPFRSGDLMFLDLVCAQQNAPECDVRVANTAGISRSRPPFMVSQPPSGLAGLTEATSNVSRSLLAVWGAATPARIVSKAASNNNALAACSLCSMMLQN